jgi:exonuclease V gamma subunit
VRKKMMLPPFIVPLPLQPLPERIRLQHLRQLARNPLQFYLTQSLGIYLDAREAEELLLSPLDKAILRQQGTQGKIATLLNTYAARGKLPQGSFGRLAISEAEEETAHYEETLKRLHLLDSPSYTVEFSPFCHEARGHGVEHLLFPALRCENTQLIGKLNNVSSQGLRFHGEDSLEDFLKVFPLFLSFYHLPFEKNLFFTKDATIKHVILQSVDQFLKRYLEFYQTALTTPLPFLPQWIPFFLKGEEKKWRKSLEEEEDLYLQWILKRDPGLFCRIPFSVLQAQAVHFFGGVERLYGI